MAKYAGPEDRLIREMHEALTKGQLTSAEWQKHLGGQAVIRGGGSANHWALAAGGGCLLGDQSAFGSAKRLLSRDHDFLLNEPMGHQYYTLWSLLGRLAMWVGAQEHGRGDVRALAEVDIQQLAALMIVCSTKPFQRDNWVLWPGARGCIPQDVRSFVELMALLGSGETRESVERDFLDGKKMVRAMWRPNPQAGGVSFGDLLDARSKTLLDLWQRLFEEVVVDQERGQLEKHLMEGTRWPIAIYAFDGGKLAVMESNGNANTGPGVVRLWTPEREQPLCYPDRKLARQRLHVCSVDVDLDRGIVRAACSNEPNFEQALPSGRFLWRIRLDRNRGVTVTRPQSPVVTPIEPEYEDPPQKPSLWQRIRRGFERLLRKLGWENWE